MNRDAASETQYEDSKSQLSTYRKDDKIMLKRKLLSVLLALVLVVSMAVPALAAPHSGNYGGVSYTLTTGQAVTTGYAEFNFGATVHVSLYASAIVQPYGENATVAHSTSASGPAYAYVSLNNGSYGSLPISAIVATAYAGSDLVRSVTDYY